MDAENYDGVLGLEHQAVRLHEHTTLWAELYESETINIRQALGPLLVAIEHYGSTSIPGIKAKPILDILVGIKRFEDGLLCIAPLEAIGYDYAPNAGIPGDYTFGKNLRRTHLCHVVEYGGLNWTLSLRFRDALRNDGVIPANSNDQSIPRFTWWPNLGTSEYVQYNWAQPVTLASAQVYWFQDGAGCFAPASWQLFYKNSSGQFVSVPNPSGYGTALNQFNATTFSSISTTALRVQAQFQAGHSGGVLKLYARPAR